MKKCPTCDKEFEDSMKFCQVDGTLLVDDAPAFDPYATMVAPAAVASDPTPPDEPVFAAEVAPADEPADEPVAAAEPTAPAYEEPAYAAPVDEATDEAASYESPSSTAIELPDDVLDLPEADPLKTVYVSDDEMKAALSGDKPADEPDDLELDAPTPEPPSFAVPDLPSPSFGDITPPSPGYNDMAPPPSPFSAAAPPAEDPVPAPSFDEPETVIQPAAGSPFDVQSAAPIAEWTPPPAPEASWQNQDIGPNTPFQPPPAGTAGENKTLAIISLVTGILSLLCCGWFIPGIAAIVMGFIARGKAASDPANYGGAGMALGGIITGVISIILGIIVVILYMIGALASLMR